MLISKAINARDRGAKAVIVVNGKTESGQDDLVKFGGVSGPVFGAAVPGLLSGAPLVAPPARQISLRRRQEGIFAQSSAFRLSNPTFVLSSAL